MTTRRRGGSGTGRGFTAFRDDKEPQECVFEQLDEGG